MMDRYLVSGATGFIGANVVRELVRQKCHVSILTRTKRVAWRLSDVWDRLNVYPCDLAGGSLQQAVDAVRPTVIFHFAAFGVNPWETDVRRMIDTNMMGTYKLIAAVKKHTFRLFINTGTSSEYGVKNRPMRETDYLEPVNDYGVTKAGATLLCTKMALREGLPIVSFRLFSPFGYFEHKKRLFPSVTLAAINGIQVAVSTPDHVRDFIFIEDVVSAYMKATTKQCAPGEIFNIAQGREKRVGDVVKTIMKTTHSHSKIVWGVVQSQGRQVEPDRWQADISKAEKILRWKPRTPFDVGVKKTVSWFKKNQALYE